MDKLKLVPFEEELKKNSELREDHMQVLREWHKKQPHLPPITDSELALFLHSNEYHIDPTKSTIEHFYTLRTHLTEVFSGRDIEKDDNLKQIKNTVLCFPLPQLSPDGYGIIYGALQDFDPSHYNYTRAVKLLSMTLDLYMYQRGTMKGLVIIFDLKGVALGHANQINLGTFKRFNEYVQAALPVRFKGMHLINSNSAMDVIMSLAKPFVKKEVLDMMHLHPKPETLENFNISLDLLPNECGGKAGAQKDLFAKELKKLEEHREWFLHEEKNQRVDEAKRANGPERLTDRSSLKGSFKKLELD
ncbi:alpha-tocopherol transfer protein-like [Copidosoma floridanum]|uniref:alpha-tocopherol transfer protein-like n=1 Tax=Copidosoma floridanum TaxID=29053 RepID=UPI0006C96EE0|nr:alpha-tocopherol transfer protein-like [Copidosoma floridanum]